MKVYKIFQIPRIEKNNNKVYKIPTKNIFKLQNLKIFLIINKNKLFLLLIQ